MLKRIVRPRLRLNYKNLANPFYKLKEYAYSKLTFFGYGTLPAGVAKGQISASIFGRTYTNILGNDGDFEDISKWTFHSAASGGSSELNADKKLFGNNSVKFNNTGGNFYRYKDIDKLDSTKYYELTVYCFVESFTSGLFSLIYYDYGGFLNYKIKSADTTKLGQWQMLKLKFTGKNDIRVAIGNGTSTIGVGYFDGMMLREMTQTEYNDSNNITHDYINNTKSTISAGRLKSVGKNLVDGKLELGRYDDITGLKIDNSNNVRNRNFIRVFSNTIDIIPSDASTAFSVYCFDINKKYLGLAYTSSINANIIRTIQLLANTAYINYRHYNSTGGILNLKVAISNTGAGLTINEPYTESNQYFIAKDSNGNIVELRSLPNGTKDEVRLSEGKATFRTKKKILEASDIVSINISSTNVDLARIQPLPDAMIWAADGLMASLHNATRVLQADRDNISKIGMYYIGTGYMYYVVAKGTTLEQARTALVGKELTYQLATPVETPIEVSGELLSFGEGTSVFVELDSVDSTIPEVGITYRKEVV